MRRRGAALCAALDSRLRWECRQVMQRSPEGEGIQAARGAATGRGAPGPSPWPSPGGDLCITTLRPVGSRFRGNDRALRGRGAALCAALDSRLRGNDGRLCKGLFWERESRRRVAPRQGVARGAPSRKRGTRRAPASGEWLRSRQVSTARRIQARALLHCVGEACIIACGVVEAGLGVGPVSAWRAVCDRLADCGLRQAARG